MVVPSIKPTTSAARIAANRENAKRSTGPRTEAGKANSRLNGLKHGLRAQLPIIPGEDPEAFRKRLDDWMLDLDPRTEVERYLIESAVMASWRLDRCRRAETAALTRKLLELETQTNLKTEQRVQILGERLFRAPDYGRRQLRQTTHGCRWLLEQWKALDLALNTWPVLHGSDFQRALHLLGKELKDWHCDPIVGRILSAYLASIFGNDTKEERLEKTRGLLEVNRPALMGPVEFERRVLRLIEELPTVIAGQVQLVEMVAEAIRELEVHLEQVKTREAKDRAPALEEAMIEDSREGATRLRYEMAHQRVFRSALSDLRKAQEARAERGEEGEVDWSDSVVPLGFSEEFVALPEADAGDHVPAGMAEGAVTLTEANAGAVGVIESEVPAEANAAPLGRVEIEAGPMVPAEPNAPCIGSAGSEEAASPVEASREPNESAAEGPQTAERDEEEATERRKATETTTLGALVHRLGPLFALCVLFLLCWLGSGLVRPARSRPERPEGAGGRVSPLCDSGWMPGNRSLEEERPASRSQEPRRHNPVILTTNRDQARNSLIAGR